MLKYLFTIIIFLLIIILNCLKNKMSKNKFFILKTIMVVLFLEVTVFNINSYRTDFDKLKYDMNFFGDDLQEKLTITTNGTQYIYLDNLNEKVKTIYLELSGLEENEVVGYDIFYSDDSTQDRFLASKEYCQEVEKTKYSVVSLSGNCKSLAINVKSPFVRVNGISLNRSIPFEINFVRIFGIIFICIFIYSLKTNDFWKRAYNYKDFYQNLVLIFITVIGMLSILFINKNCGGSGFDMYSDNLVKALSKGQVEISDTPDISKLEGLKNPYDAIERGELERDEDYIWDAAYYNQKYYVYFGALPAILLMVPYYLITKKLLTSSIVTLIFSLLSVIILSELTKRIIEKYFKEIPFKYMALSILMMIFGTNLIFINVAPRFYELVTVAGFFFAILGFFLVFDSERNEKISYKNIFFGCLSLALAVACRPTQLFASLLILPILFKIFKKNLKEKKNILKLLLTVSIPYIVVGSLIMRYNYLRFGNVFEFGEKYQLTINDMRNLKLRLINLPVGLLCSLFGLPTFQGIFPFLHVNGNIIDSFSYFYVEDMIGGVFFLAPIAFFCFGIFWLWKNSKNKDLKIFSTSILIVGLIFASFIAIKAGCTGRYLLDFAWIFVLCGILIFLEILNNLKTDEGKKILGKVFNFIFTITIIINILSGFCIIGGENSMKNNSPKEYYKSEYTIMFLK